MGLFFITMMQFQGFSLKVFKNTLSGVALLAILFVVPLACTDPYTPKTTQVNYNYLVVDGFLNTGGDSTFITLTRTHPLNGQDTQLPETEASVGVEDEQGNRYPLLLNNKGKFAAPDLHLDATKNYRLHIVTKDNKEYASEYVPVRQTPVIDSVGLRFTNYQGAPGVQAYVNAHDVTGKTVYYLWTFDETWEYNSAFISGLVRLPGDTLVYRSDDIYHCWTTQGSTTILVGSTTSLAQDQISDFPLTFIPQLSPKLSYKYSLLVHQYAITKEAYQYWTAIKKNTENIGTLFGSLPTQITGNFTCITSPSEQIFGFFSAASQHNLRNSISADQLPPVDVYDTNYKMCAMNYVILAYAFFPTTNYYLYPVFAGRTLIGYQTGTPACTDCRLNGGVIQRPPFW